MIMPRAPKVFTIALLTLILSWAAGSGAALANPDAERFTATLLGQGTAILRDRSGGDANSSARLHQFVLQNVDARKTALFALGIFQHGLDQKVVDTYVAAFTDYLTAIYEARLAKYSDLEIKVLGSNDNTAGDITVITQGKPLNDRSAREPIIIAFRLLGATGRYKIVDVQVAGMWISIDQRERFSQMLTKNNCDIRALTGYLSNTTVQIKSGTKAA